MTKLPLLALLFVAACGASTRAPEIPRGAVAIEHGEQRACACVLFHLTTSAAATRSVDRARLVELTEKDETLCVYEILADGDEVQLDRSSELRPFLVLSQSQPVDLAMKPGDAQLHLVEHVENACAPSVAATSGTST